MNSRNPKTKAPLNRTITIDSNEIEHLKKKLLKDSVYPTHYAFENKIINRNLFEIIDNLPENFVDLLFIDPPYNLEKKYNKKKFKALSYTEYCKWLDSWIKALLKVLKPNASIYICCDWKSSSAVYETAAKYFIVRNRITWEREKGRGAQNNWKNCSEDIWFFTLSKNYTFNVDAVKMKRRVLAPYKTEDGNPKDWNSELTGNYRVTHPSNIWTDITVPFWSMPENTEHPTQKPEKLLAKIILASTNKGDFVFDPFLGSGTTAVVANKLGRRFAGVEEDEFYCCLAQKRLELSESDYSIQGYDGFVFWERNTLSEQGKQKKVKNSSLDTDAFFPEF
jgi:site-specific DNA-methyltransferase (adenine-specific)